MNGKKELQRHCKEVYIDLDDTREVQENRIEFFKKKGDQQFTMEGRNAEKLTWCYRPEPRCVTARSTGLKMCRQIHLTRHFSHALLHTIRCA